MSASRRTRYARRIHPGELVSAASALTLLALMFASEWYGVDRPPGKANGAERATAENAWHGLTVTRWLMLLTIGVAIGSLILHLNQHSHGEQTDTDATVTVLGAVTAAVLTYRVLIDLPSRQAVVDQKLGAYLGMLSAYGIALGGYHCLRQARERARAGNVGATRPGAGVAERPQSR